MFSLLFFQEFFVFLHFIFWFSVFLLSFFIATFNVTNSKTLVRVATDRDARYL